MSLSESLLSGFFSLSSGILEYRTGLSGSVRSGDLNGVGRLTDGWVRSDGVESLRCLGDGRRSKRFGLVEEVGCLV
jgi:hypothetical protein